MPKTTLNSSLIIFLWLISLNGCNREPELSRSDLARLTLDQFETAAEERSLSGMLKHISQNYQDHEGHDFKNVKQLLQLELIKNQSINIFSSIRELNIIGDAATIEMSLAMAGRGVDLSTQENRLRADTFRFSVLMKWQDDRWLIRSVSWRKGW